MRRNTEILSITVHFYVMGGSFSVIGLMGLPCIKEALKLDRGQGSIV